MIKNRLFTFLSLMAVVFLATGCFEESGLEKVYDGPTVVEWDRSDSGSDAIYLAGSGQTPRDSVVINLVGPQQDEPVTVQWRINEEASTAIEGVHYNILSDQNITIPANSSFGEIEFEVITDNFTLEDDLSIVFEIVEAGVPVSANYGTLVHEMAITCPSDIAGEYATLSTGVYGEGGTASVSDFPSEVTLTELEPGLYSISDMTFGIYEAAYGDVEQPGTLQDICGEVTLVNSADAYGDPFTGVGTVDENGVITLEWSNTWGEAFTTILTPAE